MKQVVSVKHIKGWGCETKAGGMY